MLLREFLEKDIQNYLESLVLAQAGKTDLALEQELNASLKNSMYDESPQKMSNFPRQSAEEIDQTLQTTQQPVQNFAPPRENNPVNIHFHNSDEDGSFDPLLNSSKDNSSLKDMIHDEIEQFNPDGSPKKANDKTLKSFRAIVHAELEEHMKELEKIDKKKLAIEESLLHGKEDEKKENEQKLIEIERRDQTERSKRDELSLLARLEDRLIELKFAMRSNNDDRAKKYYLELKKEIASLNYYPQEKRYLANELYLTSKQLFPNGDEEPLIKDGFEIIDPIAFSSMEMSPLKKKVYHVGINSLDREAFSENFKIEGRTVYVTSPDGKVVPKVINTKKSTLLPQTHSIVSSAKRNTFFETEPASPFLANQIERSQKLKTLHENAKPVRSLEHDKQYLKAIKAIKQNDKKEAMHLLAELANHYPKSRSIKIRLMEAASLHG